MCRSQPDSTRRVLIGAMIAGGALLTPPVLSGQQVPQFRATVSRVQVDMIVTDAGGEFIDDLRLDELAVFEDERPQTILGVELVDLGARETRRLASASEPSGSVERAASRVLQPGELGAVVFLIDLPGLYWRDKNRFADALIAVQEKADELGVPYAAYVVNQVGELYELVPLTYSVARLLEAGRELRATPLARSRDDIFRLLESHLAPMTGSAANAKRRLNNLRERVRSYDTYEMLSRVVSSLAARDGRTALVWVANGVELGSTHLIEGTPREARNPAELAAPPRDWMYYQPDPRIERLAEDFYRSANTSNVSVYAVDPSTLMNLYPGRRAGSSADTAGNSLRHVAEATGGKASVGATDLQTVLRTIERDAGRFYLLTYAPSHDGEDGEYHEIRVEVSRAGAEVRARRGYSHYSEVDRLSRMIRGALDLPGVVAGFDLQIEGIRARDASGQALLVVDTVVPEEQRILAGAGQSPAMSQLEPDNEVISEVPAAAAPLLLYAVVRDADDNVAATVQAERLARPGDGAAATAISEPGLPAYLRHRAVYQLDPGSYDVRVVVVDPQTERLGAAKLEVEIADAAGEWDVSDLWLAIEDAGGATSSAVAGSFASGQKAGVYVEVYRGEGPVLSGRISDRAAAGTMEADDKISISGLEQAQGPSYEMPSLPLTHEGGIHRGTLWLPELPPGDYVLQVRVDDPLAGRERTTRVPFRVTSGR
jgi:VWFA-related protein